MPKLITSLILLLTLLHSSTHAKDININQLANDAKVMKRVLFVFLHRNDCTYCDSMISFTLDDDRVRSMIEKDFLFVPININENDKVIYNDFSGSAHDFAKQIDYDFYPTSVFIDENNKIIYSSIGYEEENDFTITLQYIKSKAYKELDIDEYKANMDIKE